MTPAQEKHEWWMFRSHSRAELREWGNALRFFRFCRAIGGHANDGDTLEAALRFNDLDGLHALCRALGFSLTPLPADEPQPVPGQAYGFTDYSKFRSPIREYPLWEAPGPQHVGGVKVSISINDGQLKLTVYGADMYEITDADVDNAKLVEVVLAPLADAIVDPPTQSDLCLSPALYPAFFAGSTSLYS